MYHCITVYREHCPLFSNQLNELEYNNKIIHTVCNYKYDKRNIIIIYTHESYIITVPHLPQPPHLLSHYSTALIRTTLDTCIAGSSHRSLFPFFACWVIMLYINTTWL